MKSSTDAASTPKWKKFGINNSKFQLDVRLLFQKSLWAELLGVLPVERIPWNAPPIDPHKAARRNDHSIEIKCARNVSWHMKRCNRLESEDFQNGCIQIGASYLGLRFWAILTHTRFSFHHEAFFGHVGIWSKFGSTTRLQWMTCPYQQRSDPKQYLGYPPQSVRRYSRSKDPKSHGDCPGWTSFDVPAGGIWRQCPFESAPSLPAASTRVEEGD